MNHKWMKFIEYLGNYPEYRQTFGLSKDDERLVSDRAYLQAARDIIEDRVKPTYCSIMTIEEYNQVLSIIDKAFERFSDKQESQ